MTNRYDVGQLVRVKITFTENFSGDLIDPTTITAYYQTPTKETTVLVFDVDASLIRESIGVYYTDIELTESGKWNYRFKGEGAVVSASQSYFNVDSLVIDE